MDAWSDGMLIRFAENLMKDVYYPFSACIWFDSKGNILKLWQFDTMFCLSEVDVPENASACWLISNHPNGDMCPFEEDMRNRERIAGKCFKRQLRMFITSEDAGIREIYE